MEINAGDIKKLMEGAVPERTAEISQYYAKYAPRFSLSNDCVGFVFEAGPFGILRFTHRTMLQMWLLGFAAKKALHSYSSLIACLLISNTNFDADLTNNIQGQQEADGEYDKLIKAVYRLAETPNIESFDWPREVPVPERGRPKDIENAAVFDLNCMAAAYVFLHEMKHIAFILDGNCPTNPIEEEIKCDEFARKIMLEYLHRYAQESGYPLDKLKTKRAMSIALALFFMLVITPEELRGGSMSHPSMAERISAVVVELDLPDNDIFWIYLGSILLSQLRYIEKIPDELGFPNIKDLCYSLVECINNTSNKTKTADAKRRHS